MQQISPFKYWVQQTVPAVYDDSLSYYEMLAKVYSHLESTDTLTNSMIDLWNTVEEWVMGEGISESVNTKLDEMSTDGTLDHIINVSIFDNLNTRINEVAISCYDFYTSGMEWADAINNAITSSKAGDTILFPFAATVGKTINLLPDRSYIGHKWGTSIKVKDGANLLYAVALMDKGTFNSNVLIRDILIDGNKATNGQGHGLYLQSIQHSTIENVKVINARQSGIYMDGVTERHSNTVHIIECRTSSCGAYGLFLSSYCEDMHVIGGDFGQSQSDNIFIQSPSSSLRDLTSWGSLANGVKIDSNTPNVQIWNCQVEGNANNGIEVHSSFAFISGNKIYDNANIPANYGNFDGVVVIGASADVLKGVTIVNNQIFSGLYSNTGKHRYAIAFDNYHINAVVMGNSLKYQGNGVVDTTKNFVNGLLDGDDCDYSWNHSSSHAYPTVNQAIVSDGAYHKVNFPTELYDIENEYDPTTSRFTTKENGFYNVNTNVMLDSLTAGSTAYLSLRVNGLEKYRLSGGSQAATGFYIMGGARILKLVKGDYVEVFVMSSQNCNVLGDNAFTSLSVSRIRN